MVLEALHDPKVAKKGSAARIEEDVRRLDVAMDDSPFVGMIERSGDVGEPIAQRGWVAGDGAAVLAPTDAIGQRSSCQQWHDKIWGAIVSPGGHNGDDVTVRERPAGLDLAIETTCEAIAIINNRSWILYDHRARCEFVPSEVRFPHPALCENRGDPKATLDEVVWLTHGFVCSSRDRSPPWHEAYASKSKLSGAFSRSLLSLTGGLIANGEGAR
jgi:hypothetical protein